MTDARGYWVVVATLVLSLLVTLVPVALPARPYLPDWPTLVLCYWVMALPHRVGVFSACALGLAGDILDGSPLGASAIGTVLVVLLILLNYQRLRQFDPWQQSLLVGLMVALVHLIEQRMESLLGWQHGGLAFLAPLVASSLVWVPLRNVLRAVRRYYEVQ